MAEVQVRIGDRDFLLACDDGQEKRLELLASEFDARVKDAKNHDDLLGDRQAMLIVALAILDEFDEAKARWSTITPDGVAAEWAANRLDEVSERLERALSQMAKAP